MYSLAAFFTVIALIAVVNGAVEFSYSDQEAWDNLTDSYCDGNRQSPINIVTDNVRNNTLLTKLEMNSYWSSATSGSWKNNGHTLKFTPNSYDATTTNHIGTYVLRQFHFHWGPNPDVGSENTVNGASTSGELHFVHQNTTSVATGSQYTVVAVFLISNSSMNIAGTIWDRLNSAPSFNMSQSVSNIIYNQLLPDNLDYYYFPGSLTTPLCNEIVQWFVLKTPISVPAAFFTNLRSIQSSVQGVPLTLNYRDVQPLNGRTVYQYNSSSVVPALTFALLILSVIVAAFINF